MARKARRRRKQTPKESSRAGEGAAPSIHSGSLSASAEGQPSWELSASVLEPCSSAQFQRVSENKCPHSRLILEFAAFLFITAADWKLSPDGIGRRMAGFRTEGCRWRLVQCDMKRATDTRNDTDELHTMCKQVKNQTTGVRYTACESSCSWPTYATSWAAKLPFGVGVVKQPVQ